MQSRRRARRAPLMYRLPEFDAPRPLSEVVPGGDSGARRLRALAASAHAGRHNHEGARAATALLDMAMGTPLQRARRRVPARSAAVIWNATLKS